MTRFTKLAIGAAALFAAITPAAHAAKPVPSGSTAPAQVFFPNPVQSLGDETLTDQKDANYPALGRWLSRVEALPGYERTYPPHWRDAS